MKNALLKLLTDLDTIGAVHTEIFDTAVREELHGAIFDSFINKTEEYELSRYYAMFSDEANELIHEALERFLANPEVIAARDELATSKERLNVFQNSSVVSSEGIEIGDYFGWVY